MRPRSRRWAAATAIEIRWPWRQSRRHSDQETSGPDCAAWWCRTKLTLGSSPQPHHGPVRMSPEPIIRESQGHDLANTRWRRLVRRTSRADHTSRQITRQGRSHGKADHTARQITRQGRSHGKADHTSCRQCAAERRRTRATRHAGRDPLTWANIGSAAAGADTEHDGTAPDPLVVPKSIATTEKSGTKLFASAVRRLLPSVNVHRCYLVPAGMARQTG